MSKDISTALDGWDYDPDQVSVRIIRGEDGRERIQLRLDLGILQMELDGRPDGKRVMGQASWLDYFQRKQRDHDARNPDGTPFRLEREDCAHLLREGVQYYHRYVSFWHLERYELCARDTMRNLRLFAFVREFARHPQDKLQFDQWRPYVTMMHTRAVATPLLSLNDDSTALRVIEAGITSIRNFLEEYEQTKNADNCDELTFLTRWRNEILARRTDSTREPYNPIIQLKAELKLAVSEERFEDAAKLRDTIRQHAEPDSDAGDSADA